MRAKRINFLLNLLFLSASIASMNANAQGEIEGNTGVFSSTNGETTVSTSIVKLNGDLHGLINTKNDNSHCRTRVILSPEKHLQVVEQSCTKELGTNHELSKSISKYCKSPISNTIIGYDYLDGEIRFTIHRDGKSLTSGQIDKDGEVNVTGDFCKLLPS